jgi:hypothetical protein
MDSAPRRDLILVALSNVLATFGQHLNFSIPTHISTRISSCPAGSSLYATHVLYSARSTRSAICDVATNILFSALVYHILSHPPHPMLCADVISGICNCTKISAPSHHGRFRFFQANRRSIRNERLPHPASPSIQRYVVPFVGRILQASPSQSQYNLDTPPPPRYPLSIAPWFLA